MMKRAGLTPLEFATEGSLGLDFGTTNSAAARAAHGEATLATFRTANGSTQTFPLWVYGAAQRTGGSVPPQVNVMGTLIFGFGVLLAVLGAVSNRKKA
jgi:hypothetical protein